MHQKFTNFLIPIIFMGMTSSHILAQDEDPSGLLGDNFSLENALEEFKKAKDLSSFEKALNKENNRVHNLDLNGDNDIDYITVNDHMDGDVHAIVISAIVGKDDVQDVAVIEIEKTGKDNATLQIVGDEDFYGEGMIVEPFDVEAKSDGSGPDGNYEYARIVVNVWFWPSVRYIYGPSYAVYHSPWYWSYYPGWWRPWRPLAWTVWRPHRVRYAPVYRITPVRRVTRATVVYRPHRRVSKTVTVKHKTTVTKARSHKVTTTKTTTAGVAKSNGKAVAAKKSTTTAKSKKGVKKSTSSNVKAKKGNKTARASKKTKVKKSKKGKAKGVKKTKKVKKKR